VLVNSHRKYYFFLLLFTLFPTINTIQPIIKAGITEILGIIGFNPIRVTKLSNTLKKAVFEDIFGKYLCR